MYVQVLAGMGADKELLDNAGMTAREIGRQQAMR
jgi:hypothetical protein